MTQHESFCLYPHTGNKFDLRPVSCGACGAIWDRRQGYPRDGDDRTCWGLEPGSTANGIANLLWLAVLAGAVIFAIVMLA